MKIVSKSTEETRDLAFKFVEAIGRGDKAVVVALDGDLGSAKTTFSQFVGEALGIKGAIQSPTFLIEKIYELYDKPWKYLIHIDAYRLEIPEELLHLGWQEMISRPDNLILIEWANRVESILPEDAIRIKFAFVDENTREISFEENQNKENA